MGNKEEKKEEPRPDQPEPAKKVRQSQPPRTETNTKRFEKYGIRYDKNGKRI